MQPRVSRSAIWFYGLALVALIVAFFSVNELQEILVDASELAWPWVLVALGAQILTYFFVARLFYGAVKLYAPPKRISLWEFFQTAIIVTFFNQTLPAVGASGATYLFSRLTKKGIAPNRAASVLILQVLTYNLARLSLLIASVLLYIEFVTRDVNRSLLIIGAIGVAIYAAIIGIIVIFGERKALSRLYQKLNRWKLGALLNRVGLNEGMFAQEDWHGTRWLFTHGRWMLIRSFFWQILVILADVTTCYALYLGLGISIPFISVMLAFLLTVAVSTISITPGSIALFEGALTFFYVSLGIDLQTALTVTLFYRALSFWLPMPIGFYLHHRSSKK